MAEAHIVCHVYVYFAFDNGGDDDGDGSSYDNSKYIFIFEMLKIQIFKPWFLR